MEQTRFMGDKILNFFKHLSVTKRVLLGIITLLVIGYIFCLPRQLFHVPYSTVVTDRNGELLGARIASDGQWRFPPRKTTPEKIRQCLITFEDKNFYYHWGVDQSSYRTFALDRWTESNPSQNVLMPRLHKDNANNANNQVASTWWLRNGGFLRLKNMEFGYQLPKQFLKKFNVQAARIYVMGYNLALWDNLK